MGGTPISSLQLVSWPREDIGFDVLSDVIKGGADVMNLQIAILLEGTVLMTKNQNMVLL